MLESSHLKEKGNELFKDGKYGEAATMYTKALGLVEQDETEEHTLLKNRAACYLKLEKYTEVVVDCSKVLDKHPGDSKALYRRSLAFEALGKLEEAYKDAKLLAQCDQKNTSVQPLLQRLHCSIQDKINKEQSMDNKVEQMIDLMFKNKNEDEEKRKQAINNLVVLAKDSASAAKMFASGIVPKLLLLLETEKDKELRVNGVRVLSCMANQSKERSVGILGHLTLKLILANIGCDDDAISTATTNLLQNIIQAVTNLDAIHKEREKHEATRKAEPGSRLRPFPFVFEKIDPDGIAIVDDMLASMVRMLGSGKISGFGRDNIIELFVKFVTRKDGIGWTMKFINETGVQQLLTVAGTIAEHKTIKVTPGSRMLVSLVLSKLYEDTISDQEREKFLAAVEAYFLDLFRDEILDSKLEAVLALSALLQGVPKVGNAILSKEGVLEIILAMADSGDAIHVKYAVEALVQSASKKEKCSGVIKQATPILKQLYMSPNEAVKVRALVGLCKLGSFGGADASVKTFAEGSNLTLAKACRKFLCNEAKDVDLRKWAAEGLAYLTLDADVKEDLVTDSNALKSLIDLAKVLDKGILYPLAQIFVNLTNSYEKKDIEPELLELAKYAKQHVPEEHEKDKEPYIKQRVDLLVKAGIVNALVLLTKSDSENSNELLARVYLAICANPEHRGLVVQQGGVKSLLVLANEGSTKGKMNASHALARIAVTQNPEIAFPGQRACEVVRPLLKLLAIDCTSLENFEALLGLTNLAAMSDDVRNRLIKEKGFPRIEHFCYEEHEQLRQAAVECICNLVVNEQVVEMFKGENDRVKMLLLYSGDEEDEKLVKAAAGALAILTYDNVICHKVVTCTKQWVEILGSMAAHESQEIQHRGIYIIRNLMATDKELAQMLVGTPLLEILMAVTKLPSEMGREQVVGLAKEVLELAQAHKLIQPSSCA